MNILTRLWTHGRCCGLSKVQKLMLTGFLVWANARPASGADVAAPRPATPIPRTTSRRVGLPIANFFIVSSPIYGLYACGFWPIFEPYSWLLGATFTLGAAELSHLSDLRDVPAAAAITESFPSIVGHRDGVLEFEKPTLWMEDCRFDRDHHPPFERQVLIGGWIGHYALAGQMRGLMANQSHAVGE